MIKVISFIASCAGEKSNTKRYADDLVKELQKKASQVGEEITYECISGADVAIEFCRSCDGCFYKNCDCPVDSIDDMPRIKKAFRDADIILFGTPVYVAEMSGIAKSVIDRIACWSHRFELAGKVAFPFVTTSSTWASEVVDKLKQIFMSFGAAVPDGGYAYTVVGKPKLGVQSEMCDEFESAANRILDCWKSMRDYITTQQESVFERTKQFLLINEYIRVMPEGDAAVCMERNIIGYRSYADYVEMAKDKSRTT